MKQFPASRTFHETCRGFNNKNEMEIRNSYITLNNLHYYAYHGVAAQENRIGNEYTVNLRLKVDIRRAAETDEVEHTVNYAEVYEVVKSEMAVPSRLLEHVCARISKALLQHFPMIEEIEISLSKRNPPMGADIETAGVTMVCSR